MVGNSLEPEQIIEIVDSTNNLVGYVSRTLPDAFANPNTDDNIVTIEHIDDNHDDSELIGPEAPPKIPSDKDIVMSYHADANHDDSNGDSDSDTLRLVLGQMLHLTFLLTMTTHYHLMKAHVVILIHMKLLMNF